LHRRNCAEWNRKNTAYFKSIYLDKKLGEDGRSPLDSTQPDVREDAKPAPKSRIDLNLPRDVLDSRIGRDNLIIAQYLIEQIFCRIRSNATAFP
jgi:hypothetical protein